jgi:hypothetical protein
VRPTDERDAHRCYVSAPTGSSSSI